MGLADALRRTDFAALKGDNAIYLDVLGRWLPRLPQAWALPLSIIAFVLIVVWGVTGPIFQYSDTWQLVINTATTIVTFLMVFLIQNTQNRDAKALHLELDELLRGVKGARTSMVDLENLADEQLEDLQQQFEGLRRRRSSGSPDR